VHYIALFYVSEPYLLQKKPAGPTKVVFDSQGYYNAKKCTTLELHYIIFLLFWRSISLKRK